VVTASVCRVFGALRAQRFMLRRLYIAYCGLVTCTLVGSARTEECLESRLLSLIEKMWFFLDGKDNRMRNLSLPRAGG
jgi:hypothetical protein